MLLCLFGGDLKTKLDIGKVSALAKQMHRLDNIPKNGKGTAKGGKGRARSSRDRDRDAPSVRQRKKGQRKDALLNEQGEKDGKGIPHNSGDRTNEENGNSQPSVKVPPGTSQASKERIRSRKNKLSKKSDENSQIRKPASKEHEKKKVVKGHKRKASNRLTLISRGKLFVSRFSPKGKKSRKRLSIMNVKGRPILKAEYRLKSRMGLTMEVLPQLLLTSFLRAMCRETIG